MCSPKLLPQQPPLRIRPCAQLRLTVEKVSRASICFFGHRRLIFATAGPAAQMIERHVRHDSIQPRIKTALKPEAMQVAINSEEAFLINIARVFGSVNQVHRQAQNFAVVAPNQFLECQAISCLGVPDERVLLRKLQHRCLARISFECDAHPHGVCGQSVIRSDWFLNIGTRKPAFSGLMPFCGFRKDRRVHWPLVSTYGWHFPTIGQLPQSMSFRFGCALAVFRCNGEAYCSYRAS